MSNDIFKNIDLFIPEDLRELEFYPKLVSMLEFIMDGVVNDLKDVKYKYADPSQLSEDAITETINEYGFSYISELMGTLTDIEIDTLVYFLGLIHYLKGHRTGLELVLKILGLETSITEWWETDPKGEPMSFCMVVFMDENVKNIYLTLDKIKKFVRHYVYPRFEKVEITFTFPLAEKNIIVAGFVDKIYYGTITG